MVVVCHSGRVCHHEDILAISDDFYLRVLLKEEMLLSACPTHSSAWLRWVYPVVHILEDDHVRESHGEEVVVQGLVQMVVSHWAGVLAC
jgi:hypothetical protein